MTSINDLGTNKNDIGVAFLKSLAVFIPGWGQFIGEVIGELIPNQRIDRITNYLKELEIRFSNIQEEVLNKLKEDVNFIELIEESFYQASRAVTNERIQYIAEIVTNGIKDETIEFQESKYLLKLLQELNDIEIIWLRYYLFPGGDDDFQEKHPNILNKISTYSGVSEETYNKAALQESYIEHLKRLKLIKSEIRIDKKTGIPAFDSHGNIQVSYTYLSELGGLLLKQIGLYDDEVVNELKNF